MRIGTSEKMAASGVVHTGPCELTGILLSMDGINDVTDLALYDGLDATGTEIIPTCPFEADYKGLNGVVGISRGCRIGLYLEFVCAGAAEVTVFFRPI